MYSKVKHKGIKCTYDTIFKSKTTPPPSQVWKKIYFPESLAKFPSNKAGFPNISSVFPDLKYIKNPFKSNIS